MCHTQSTIVSCEPGFDERNADLSVASHITHIVVYGVPHKPYVYVVESVYGTVRQPLLQKHGVQGERTRRDAHDQAYVRPVLGSKGNSRAQTVSLRK